MSDKTPAETLRSAAKLMRERAEKAGGGKWEHRDTWVYDGPYEIADIYGPDRDAIGEHIASWHPKATVKAAAMLDKFAWIVELDAELAGRVGFDEVLDFARAYLGEVSDV